MITFAIVGVCVIAISRLTRYVFDTWWLSTSKTELQEQSREAMYWISKDFKSAYSSTIGNAGPIDAIVGHNTGFEKPLGAGVVPTGWTNPLPAGVDKVDFTDNVRSGFSAIRLTGAVNYDSNVFTLTNTGRYVLSGWLFNATGAGQQTELRLLDGGGNNFAPNIFISSTTTSAPYWVHISTVTPTTQILAAGQNCIIRLNNINAGISYFDNVSISPLDATFTPATGVGSYEYELSTGRYRIYFDTYTIAGTSIKTGRISRQLWDGANWQVVDPYPLSNNVESFSILNNIQEPYRINLMLVDHLKKGLPHNTTYEIITRIYPIIQ